MAKRQSAFSKALLEAQKKEPDTQLGSVTVEQFHSEAAKPYHRETVSQPDSETGKQANSKAVEPLDRETVKSELEKTSFYIPHTQLDKLDDLVHEYKKRIGKRINRNDIVRALINQVDLDSLVASLAK